MLLPARLLRIASGLAVSVAVLCSSGCVMTPSQLHSWSNYDLCKAFYQNQDGGLTLKMALSELRARGFNCAIYKEPIMADAGLIDGTARKRLGGAPSTPASAASAPTDVAAEGEQYRRLFPTNDGQ